MGNRSSLTVFTADDDIVVQFEADNSLPYFWIGLLDHDLIDSVAPAWRRIDDAHGNDDDATVMELLDEDPAMAEIEIPIDRFETNSRRTRHWLAGSAPERLALFDGFTGLIATALVERGQRLTIDILEHANFTSVDEFIVSLHENIALFDRDDVDSASAVDIASSLAEHPIPFGSGFSEQLRAASAPYRAELEARERDDDVVPRSVHRARRREVGVLRPLVEGLFYAAISIFLTVAAVVGQSKEGMSSTVVLAGLLGVAAGVYAFFLTRRALRRFRARRTDSDSPS